MHMRVTGPSTCFDYHPTPPPPPHLPIKSGTCKKVPKHLSLTINLNLKTLSLKLIYHPSKKNIAPQNDVPVLAVLDIIRHAGVDMVPIAYLDRLLIIFLSG